MLEVAAVLGGRPARGAAQRRFVAAHVQAMDAITVDLHEQHDAWVAARAEVEALAGTTIVAAPLDAPKRGGALVVLLVALMFPAFLVWDLVRLGARGVVALLDGVALRVRTIGTLSVRAARQLAVAAARVRRQWTEVRLAFATAGVEARRRVTAARLRTRLRISRLRRQRRTRAG